MQQRSKELFGLTQTVFIMPSININVETKQLVLDIKPNVQTGLFLCGWQLNKNIMLIPEIAAQLKEMNVPFQFVLTAPLNESVEHLSFVEKAKELDVMSMITITGPIHKTELTSLFQQINFVFLLSKLESFSNNIIEAWFYKKVLIISDELWAKSICQNAAIYVDRDNIKQIATTIKTLVEDSLKVEQMVKVGTTEISKYPTINERTEAEINYIKKVYETN